MNFFKDLQAFPCNTMLFCNGEHDEKYKIDVKIVLVLTLVKTQVRNYMLNVTFSYLQVGHTGLY